MKRLIYIFVSFFALTVPVKAQKLLWNVDFTGFFDNREYKYEGQRSQTLFATRLSPEVGLGIDSMQHRVMVGTSWVQPIGPGFDESKLFPTVYYQYRTAKWLVSFGSFPRTQLYETLPDALQYDSLSYYRPNLTGALFCYESKQGFLEWYVDWRGMQTEKQREAFLVAFNGRWQKSIWQLGGHFVMNHLARPKNSPDHISVTDDVVINSYVGLDFSHKTVLDSLTLRCGYLMSLERNRGVGTWHAPKGVLIHLLAQWRFIGVKNTFYAGGNQQPFYRQLGNELNQGDPFYQSKLYNRTDVYFSVFRNPFINLYAAVNFHVTPGKVSTNQQLIVRLNLDQQYKQKQKSRLPILKSIL